MQWNDNMDEAPRDGVIFLSYWQDGTIDTCKAFVSRYSGGFYFHNADEQSVCCSDVLTHPSGDPVAWMPLPETPDSK